jgi:uncharacterized protein (DUF427 family)
MSRPPENVADYPRPPRLEPVPWRIRVELAGIRVADSRRAIRVLETYGAPVYYVPPGDVRMDLLSPEPVSTGCEWKGAARYWTVSAGGREVPRGAWSYPDPTPSFEAIRDHVAFYAGKLDACWVDDDRVEPQPGDFYGGWVTPEIHGPIKGAAGSHHW